MVLIEAEHLADDLFCDLIALGLWNKLTLLFSYKRALLSWDLLGDTVASSSKQLALLNLEKTFEQGLEKWNLMK